LGDTFESRGNATPDGCRPGDPNRQRAILRGIALSKLEEGFWASKTGQKLLRNRVERSFPEFIARVAGGLLTEVGLKRHYKTPEPVKLLPTAPKR
jgi:hypothetical protein